MSIAATNYLEVANDLTPETPVVFHDVSWEEYELLLEELGKQPGVHVSYDRGTLEIMTTSTEHEYYGDFLHDLIRVVTLRLKIKLRSFGRATMKKSKVLAGKEPDGCYYIKSLELIGKKIRLDFERDPPPDIVVEVDLSTNTIPKLPIYQRLGVSEVWLYDGYEMTIYRLSAQGYQQVEQSVELPGFTGGLLTKFLHASQATDDNNQLLEDYVEMIIQSQSPSA
ncbi:MAG: Uma2 family endonuclease [Blastocatellia bacterium]